jgi:hypothetical protein
MNRLGIPGLLALALALAACASRMEGGVHYDEYTDFSKRQSFAFAPQNPTLAQAPQNVQEANQIAQRDVQSYLTGRGYRFVDAGAADLLVEVDLGILSKGAESGLESEGQYGGMQILLLDPKTQRSIWSGWGRLTWRQSMNRDEEIRKAVEFILGKFPPGGAPNAGG